MVTTIRRGQKVLIGTRRRRRFQPPLHIVSTLEPLQSFPYDRSRLPEISDEMLRRRAIGTTLGTVESHGVEHPEHKWYGPPEHFERDDIEHD